MEKKQECSVFDKRYLLTAAGLVALGGAVYWYLKSNSKDDEGGCSNHGPPRKSSSIYCAQDRRKSLTISEHQLLSIKEDSVSEPLSPQSKIHDSPPPESASRTKH